MAVLRRQRPRPRLGPGRRFLSKRPDTVGEDYDVADSYLFNHREAIELACRLLGLRCHFIAGIPMWFWQGLVMQLGQLNLLLDRRFPRYQRGRVMDIGQLDYLTMGIWVSNRKLRTPAPSSSTPMTARGWRMPWPGSSNKSASSEGRLLPISPLAR